MLYLNRQSLRGFVTADPKGSQGSESLVASFCVAINERWKDRTTGALREHTQWFTVKGFGLAAEHILAHVKKGEYVQVEGKTRTEIWSDPDNPNKKHIKTLVHVIHPQNVLCLKRTKGA